MVRIGIAGYGNLGRGVELAVKQNQDMELIGVFTRRPPETVKTVTGCKVYKIDEAKDFQDKIDVMILCGGSATDLPKQGPEFAQYFHTVDSFDTHAKIPEYFSSVNEKAVASSKVSLISVGWDPGLFSLQRLLFSSVLTDGQTFTSVSYTHLDVYKRQIMNIYNG